MSGEVHFSTYVHTGTFSLKLLKGSIDKLGGVQGDAEGVVALSYVVHAALMSDPSTVL